MTRRERLEAKADKRREWAGSRSTKASAAFGRADLREETSGIPMGQPVLVGHHSEKHHRRALERADNAMRQSIEHSSMAKHHAQCADGIERQLDTSIFSDDPDALEALQAKLARLEAERAEIKAFNAKCRKGDAECIAKIATICRHTADDPRKGYPAYKLRNLGGEITRCKKRIEEVKVRQARDAETEAAGGVLVKDHGNGWTSVQFSEKPDRTILDALRGAEFSWGRGRWTGRTENLPNCVRELAPSAEGMAV